MNTQIIFGWLISTIAVLVSAFVIPGVRVENIFIAFVVAIAIGIVNAFLKPILVFLTLPVNIITLGLFTLVIDAILLLLVARVIPGFHIDGFWYAVLFAIVLSIVNGVLGGMTKSHR